MPNCPDCGIEILALFCEDITNRLAHVTELYCPYCGVKLILKRDPKLCPTCAHQLNSYTYTLLKKVG